MNKIINAVGSHYLPFCFFSNTIETIVSPNLDRLNLFIIFLCSLTALRGFLVIFRAMTQSWFLIGGLKAKKNFHWLIHVVEGISL